MGELRWLVLNNCGKKDSVEGTLLSKINSRMKLYQLAISNS